MYHTVPNHTYTLGMYSNSTYLRIMPLTRCLSTYLPTMYHYLTLLTHSQTVIDLTSTFFSSSW